MDYMRVGVILVLFISTHSVLGFPAELTELQRLEQALKQVGQGSQRFVNPSRQQQCLAVYTQCMMAPDDPTTDIVTDDTTTQASNVDATTVSSSYGTHEQRDDIGSTTLAPGIVAITDSDPYTTTPSTKGPDSTSGPGIDAITTTDNRYEGRTESVTTPEYDTSSAPVTTKQPGVTSVSTQESELTDAPATTPQSGVTDGSSTTQETGIPITTASSTVLDLPETTKTDSRADPEIVATTLADSGTEVPTTTVSQKAGEVDPSAVTTTETSEDSTSTSATKAGRDPTLLSVTESVYSETVTEIPTTVSDEQGTTPKFNEPGGQYLPPATSTSSQAETESPTTTSSSVTDSTASPEVRSGKAIESSSNDNVLDTTKSKPVPTTTQISVDTTEPEITTNDNSSPSTAAPTTRYSPDTQESPITTSSPVVELEKITTESDIEDSTTPKSMFSVIATTISSIFKSSTDTDETVTRVDGIISTTASPEDLAQTTISSTESQTPYGSVTSTDSAMSPNVQVTTTDSTRVEITDTTNIYPTESRDLPVTTSSSVPESKTTEKESVETGPATSTDSTADPDAQGITTGSTPEETAAPTIVPTERDLPLTTSSSVLESQTTYKKSAETVAATSTASTADKDVKGGTTDSTLDETVAPTSVSQPDELDLPVTTSSSIIESKTTDKESAMTGPATSTVEPSIEVTTTDSNLDETAAPTTVPSVQGRDLPAPTDTTTSASSAAETPDGTTTKSAFAETLTPEREPSGTTSSSLLQPKTESPEASPSVPATSVPTSEQQEGQGVTTESAPVETGAPTTELPAEGRDLPVTDSLLPEVTTSATSTASVVTPDPLDFSTDSTFVDTVAPTEGKFLPVTTLSSIIDTKSTEGVDPTSSPTSATITDAEAQETTVKPEETETLTTISTPEGGDLPVTTSQPTSSVSSETTATDSTAYPDVPGTTPDSLLEVTTPSTGEDDLPTTTLLSQREAKVLDIRPLDVTTSASIAVSQTDPDMPTTTSDKISTQDVQSTASPASEGRDLPLTTLSSIVDTKSTEDVQSTSAPVTTLSPISEAKITENISAETASSPTTAYPDVQDSTPGYTSEGTTVSADTTVPTTSIPTEGRDLPVTTSSTHLEDKVTDSVPQTTTASSLSGSTSGEIEVTTEPAGYSPEGRDLPATTLTSQSENDGTTENVSTNPVDATNTPSLLSVIATTISSIFKSETDSDSTDATVTGITATVPTTTQINNGTPAVHDSATSTDSAVSPDVKGITTEQTIIESTDSTTVYPDGRELPATTSSSILESKVTDSVQSETSTPEAATTADQAEGRNIPVTTSSSVLQPTVKVTTPSETATTAVPDVHAKTSTDSTAGGTAEPSVADGERDLPMTTLPSPREAKTLDILPLETTTSAPTTDSPTDTETQGTTSGDASGETAAPTTQSKHEVHDLPVTTSSSIFEEKVTDTVLSETSTPGTSSLSPTDEDGQAAKSTDTTPEQISGSTTEYAASGRDLHVENLTENVQPDGTTAATSSVSSVDTSALDITTESSRIETTALPTSASTDGRDLPVTTSSSVLEETVTETTTPASMPEDSAVSITDYPTEGHDLPTTTVTSPREGKTLDILPLETSTYTSGTTGPPAVDPDLRGTTSDGSFTESVTSGTLSASEGRDLLVTTVSSILEAKVTDSIQSETTKGYSDSSVDPGVQDAVTDSTPAETAPPTTVHPTERSDLPGTTASSVLEAKVTDSGTDSTPSDDAAPTTAYTAETRDLPVTTASSILEANVTDSVSDITPVGKAAPTTGYASEDSDQQVTTASSILEAKVTESVLTITDTSATSSSSPAYRDGIDTTTNVAPDETVDPTTPADDSHTFEIKGTREPPTETAPPPTQSIFDMLTTTISSIFKSDVSEATTPSPAVDSSTSPQSSSDPDDTTATRPTKYDASTESATLKPATSTSVTSSGSETTTIIPEGDRNADQDDVTSTPASGQTERTEQRQPKNLDGLTVTVTTLSSNPETTTSAYEKPDTTPATSTLSTIVTSVKGVSDNIDDETAGPTTAADEQSATPLSYEPDSKTTVKTPVESTTPSADIGALDTTTDSSPGETVDPTQSPTEGRGLPVTTSSSILESITDDNLLPSTTASALSPGSGLPVTTLGSILEPEVSGSTTDLSGSILDTVTTTASSRSDETPVIGTTDAVSLLEPSQDSTTEQATLKPDTPVSTAVPDSTATIKVIPQSTGETTTSRPLDDQDYTEEVLTSTSTPLKNPESVNLEDTEPRQGKKLEDVTAAPTTSSSIPETTTSSGEAKQTVIPIRSTDTADTTNIPDSTTAGITGAPTEGLDQSVTTSSTLLEPKVTDNVPTETSTAGETEAQTTSFGSTDRQGLPATTSSSVLEVKVTDGVSSETSTFSGSAEGQTSQGTTSGYISEETTTPRADGRDLPVTRTSSILEPKATEDAQVDKTSSTESPFEQETKGTSAGDSSDETTTRRAEVDAQDLPVTTSSSILEPTVTDSVPSDTTALPVSPSQSDTQGTTIGYTTAVTEAPTTSSPGYVYNPPVTTGSSQLETKMTENVPAETSTSMPSMADLDTNGTTAGYTSMPTESQFPIVRAEGRDLKYTTSSSLSDATTTDNVPSEIPTTSASPTDTDNKVQGTTSGYTSEGTAAQTTTPRVDGLDLPATTLSSILEPKVTDNVEAVTSTTSTSAADPDTQGTSAGYTPAETVSQETYQAEGSDPPATTSSSITEGKLKDIAIETKTDSTKAASLSKLDIQATTTDDTSAETEVPTTTVSPAEKLGQPTTTMTSSIPENTSAGTKDPDLSVDYGLLVTTVSSVLEPEVPETTSTSSGKSDLTTTTASAVDPDTEPSKLVTTRAPAQDGSTEPDLPTSTVASGLPGASTPSLLALETTTKRAEDEENEFITSTHIPLTDPQTKNQNKTDPRQGKTLEDLTLTVTTSTSMLETTTSSLESKDTEIPITTTRSAGEPDVQITTTDGISVETMTQATTSPTSAGRDLPATTLSSIVDDVAVTSPTASSEKDVHEFTTTKAEAETSPATISSVDELPQPTTTTYSKLDANTTDSEPAGTTPAALPSEIGLAVTTQSSLIEPETSETTTVLPSKPPPAVTTGSRSDSETEKYTTTGHASDQETTIASVPLKPEVIATTASSIELPATTEPSVEVPATTVPSADVPATTTLFSILAPTFTETKSTQRPENISSIDVTVTPSTSTTTQKSVEEMTTERRQGKTLEDNHVTTSKPRGDATEDLLQIIARLNKKIEELEATQKRLTMSIDELQMKVKDSPETLHVNEDKKHVAQDLLTGDCNQAVEKWNKMKDNIDSVGELQNATNTIVMDALEKEAPPTIVLDFIHQIPDKEVQESAYSTAADAIGGSEQLQERVYWKVLIPYCQYAQTDLGPNSTATIKMLNLQNQMRLTAAQPISSSCHDIQAQQYEPAVATWLTMVRDIPDAPGQLETNMRRIITRTYNGTAENLPLTFQYILLLPINQSFFKQVAYSCIRREMRAHGHEYDASAGTRQTRSPEIQSRDPYYRYARY